MSDDGKYFNSIDIDRGVKVTTKLDDSFVSAISGYSYLYLNSSKLLLINLEGKLAFIWKGLVYYVPNELNQVKLYEKVFSYSEIVFYGHNEEVRIKYFDLLMSIRYFFPCLVSDSKTLTNLWKSFSFDLKVLAIKDNSANSYAYASKYYETWKVWRSVSK